MEYLHLILRKILTFTRHYAELINLPNIFLRKFLKFLKISHILGKVATLCPKTAKKHQNHVLTLVS